jgi:hypothetical protein
MEKRKKYRESIGRKTVTPGNLAEQIQYGKPVTNMWRTPDAHCDRGASSEKRMKMKLEKKMPISLNDQVRHPNLMWPTPRAKEPGRTTKGYGRGLAELVEGKPQMWPTPRASAAMGEKTKTISKRLETKKSKGKLEESVAIWPTPTNRMYKLPRLPETMAKTKRNPLTNTIEDAVQHQEGKSYKETGTLNPNWVEWLMGYPIGWTDLKR